jgi:hypothetical protein
MHQKKRSYRCTLEAPLGVLVPRPPSAVWIFWYKSKKFNSAFKKISTQAQLRLDHVALQATYKLEI